MARSVESTGTPPWSKHLSGGEQGAVGWMPVTRENVDRMYSNHTARVCKAVATSGLDVRNDGTVVG